MNYINENLTDAELFRLRQQDAARLLHTSDKITSEEFHLIMSRIGQEPTHPMKAKESLEAAFTEFTKGDNWVFGVCGKFKFQAKLYDEGSIFGIKGGRVSKLKVCSNSHNKWIDHIISYD